jgi:hypothetical protein
MMTGLLPDDIAIIVLGPGVRRSAGASNSAARRGCTRAARGIQ